MIIPNTYTSVTYIYARSEEHAERQHEALRSFIGRLNHIQAVVTKSYRDFTSGPGQPELIELSDQAESALFNLVVVTDLSEINCDPAGACEFVLKMNRLGIVVVAVDDEFCSDATLYDKFFPVTN